MTSSSAKSTKNKPNSWRSQMAEYATAAKVGFFLARREIRAANIWSSILIIFIMTLTFLNLIVVRGILVGLVEGVRRDTVNHVVGDVKLSRYEEKDFIENSPQILALVRNLPQVKAVSAKYVASARLEANYKTKIKDTETVNSVGGVLIGIDPEDEIATNALNDFVIDGSFLEEGDVDQIMIGTDLLSDYSIDGTGLDDIKAGVVVRLLIRDQVREVTVKAVLDSKVQEIGQAIYLVDSQAQQLLGRSDFSRDTINLRLRPGTTPQEVKQILLANQVDRYAKVETSKEAEPSFVKDISNTFAILANIISSISLIVAAITTFIIIFVNAITQKQLIGIMKGIGIHWFAIVSSYMLQALFYTSVGITLATLIIYGLLEPYVAQNPIDFPFSDGVLLVTTSGTLYRAALLMIATLFAGYVPAKMIVNKNTLDSILGR